MRTVAVIGLGYVGLPLAVQAAEKGYQVIGIDLNTRLIELVEQRVSPFANDDRFAAALKRVSDKQLTTSQDFEQVQNADIVVICVPTPTDDNIPDLSYVTGAAKSAAKHMRQGQLVILESTVNPGVTREELLPVFEASGLTCGKDFFLAHCPERIDPGSDKFFVGNLNRVVGGITAECTEKAAEFYRSIVDAEIVPLASTEEAEFVKSWENSHRNVLIALANEAAVICDAVGMDVNNIIKGLQSKIDQFGLKLGQPGIGPGGHCIPEDIHYVIKKARLSGIDTRFLDDAAELNDKMPRYAVQQLQQMMRDKGEKLSTMRVALLGLAYKENIEDARRSPAIEVAHILMRRASHLVAHDPFVDMKHTPVKGMPAAETLDEALTDADAIFIATAHQDYREQLTAETLQKYGIRYVLDGRNCLDDKAIKSAGIVYKGIGR